jgi:uncharacterized protein YndB with AHSA1/START domain
MTETTRAVFRIDIKGSIDDVWHQLTKQGEPQAAVFNAWLTAQSLQVGNQVQMRTGSGKKVLVVGRVTAFEPPRRFSHTFRFTQYDDPECEITYELKPIDGGVQCTLIVDRMPVGTPTAKDMAGGGTMIVNTLKEVVETGRPKLGTRLMYWVFGRMEFVLPKKTNATHWPLEERK